MATTPPTTPPPAEPVAEHRVRILPGRYQFQAPDNSTLVAAAEARGLELPSSCRNGVCRACMCRMHSGQVRYIMEWPGLSREEKQEGWILPCVAQPLSELVLEVPGAQPLGWS